jgi:hypothetical protein
VLDGHRLVWGALIVDVPDVTGLNLSHKLDVNNLLQCQI